MCENEKNDAAEHRSIGFGEQKDPRSGRQADSFKEFRELVELAVSFHETIDRNSSRLMLNDFMLTAVPVSGFLAGLVVFYVASYFEQMLSMIISVALLCLLTFGYLMMRRFGIRRKISRDRDALFRMTETLRETSRFVARRQKWSSLERSIVKVLLSRLPIAPPDFDTLSDELHDAEGASTRAALSDTRSTLEEAQAKADAASEAMYETAMALYQVTINHAEDSELGSHAKAALRRAEMFLARVQVRFGPNSDVVAGANKLAHWGKPGDVELLRNALRRKGLSSDAREAMDRTIAGLQRSGPAA